MAGRLLLFPAPIPQTLKLVERRMVVPPTPTPTSFDLPYLTAIYLSTSTDQEAAYTRRGCKSVPGSLADSVGTKLWCEFESVEGSEATTPFNAIVALCVTQPSTQRCASRLVLGVGLVPVQRRLYLFSWLCFVSTGLWWMCC